MGLCKCPRKKVTNLFCFEHRVNVCEYCIVDNHPKCVVQSYLAWLQDSDYDPNCQLCRKPLGDDRTETVRLLCLHVFHWPCLDNWARSYPPNTAPAGYTCPTCRECIFPKQNQESFIVSSLKNVLMKANWARAGLGLPMIPEADLPRTQYVGNGSANSTVVNGPNNLSSTTVVPMTNDGDYGHDDNAHYSTTSRKSYPMSAHNDELDHLLTSNPSGGLNAPGYNDGNGTRRTAADADNDDNKYKRRSAFEWFRRWMNSRAPNRRLTGTGGGWTWKRTLFYTFLFVIAILTLVTVLGRLGRSSTENDSFLDPMANPNIRVADMKE